MRGLYCLLVLVLVAEVKSDCEVEKTVNFLETKLKVKLF
jgi:hypothetical protein